MALIWLTPVLAEDVTSHLREAGALLREGKPAEALKQLDRLRNGAALSALDNFQLGWLYGQARSYHTALEIFQSLPENIPDPLTHCYAVALSHFNLGEYRRTVDVLLEAKRRGATDEKSANLLGVAYAQLGEAEKAYTSLRDGIGDDPGNAEGYLNLVTLCVEYHNNPLAEKIATRGIDSFPRESRLFVSRGAVKMLQGRVEEARDDFRRAVEMAPDSADASFFSALTEYQLGRHGEAIAVLRKAARRGVTDPDIHYLLAESLLRANAEDTAQALRELDRAIELDPRSVPALVLRGKLQLKTGHAARGAADLEQARDVEPNSRSVLYSLARAYQQLGKQKEAQRLFETVQQDSANAVAEMGQKKMSRILVEKATQ